MLTQSKGIYLVECDNCGNVEELEDDFESSRAAMRRLGWTATKHGPDWTHTCPECQEDQS
jgi:Fe2+ or Zn2+ uptake regulation protein